MPVVENGVYFLREQYFLDFPDPYLKRNENERRPHYYALRDKRTSLLWMIPFTKSPGKLADYGRRIKDGKRCDVYHPTFIGGIQGLLLMADMIPVTETYIKEPYTISGIPVVFKDTRDIKEINSKARKIWALLHRGVKFTKTQPDILAIEKQLIDLNASGENNTPKR
jgi:hypothetical protein